MKVTSKQKTWGVLEKVANQVLSSTNSQLWSLPSPSSSSPPEVHKLYMDNDGTYPNNPTHPLLLYRSAFHGTQQEGYTKIVSSGEWTSPWVWGIFTYHHYHTTAWELLICVKGQADIQIGGSNGPIVNISKGDVMLVPPGLAHKQIRDSGGFTLLGSYPIEGCSGPVDTVRGAPTEDQKANIEACVTPKRDPVLGLDIASLFMDDV